MGVNTFHCFRRGVFYSKRSRKISSVCNWNSSRSSCKRGKFDELSTRKWMVTRALQLHHLDDLLHGLASSHWALEKRSLLVLGRRSISGLKRGSKCIQFLVHGVVVPLALGCLPPRLLRWFAGLRPVTWYSPLCHGVYWFCGGGENFLSHMTFWLTYYLVGVINSKIFSPGVTPGEKILELITPTR